GAERVREDDARRALAAAEEIHGAVEPPLEAAVSVATAEVVVDGTLLAGLKLAARAGELVVSEATRRLAAEPARRRDAPLVNRIDERDQLHDAFNRTARERAPRLFTLLGAAGIGKSRLAEELVAATAARVVVARCAPHAGGEPLRELLVQAGVNAEGLQT